MPRLHIIYNEAGNFFHHSKSTDLYADYIVTRIPASRLRHQTYIISGVTSVVGSTTLIPLYQEFKMDFLNSAPLTSLT